MHVKWRGLELPYAVVKDDRSATPTFGRFTAEPFERGFGTTIGNSLRRVLLSSLEGAAITKVKIAGVSHEFSTTPGVLATLAKAYAKEPFVSVSPQVPSTKATLGTNSVQITARFDERTGYVVVIAALDNLAKGASGGAMQAANVALGIDEHLGLSQVGMYP